MAFPLDQPVGSSSPSILVDVESKFIVAQQEISVDSVYCQRTDIQSFLNKVKRGVCRVQETLRVKCIEINDLESFCAANAEFAFEEVNRA